MVSNSPNAADDATATTALYLLISALRQFSKAERDIRTGKWKRDLYSSGAHDATGKTLAILGLGGIGLRFAELVHAFPMRVIYHNRHKVENAPVWCEYFGEDRFEEMLAQADVLSVHVPLNDTTVGLVGERVIRMLKKGAVLINTARGKVIDEEAMIKALEDGHVRCMPISGIQTATDVRHLTVIRYRIGCIPGGAQDQPTLIRIYQCDTFASRGSKHYWYAEEDGDESTHQYIRLYS